MRKTKIKTFFRRKFIFRFLNATTPTSTNEPTSYQIESPTPQEATILTLVASDLSDKEVAEQLCISPKTVDKHLRNVCHKLGVKKRGGAVGLAMALGLIKPRELLYFSNQSDGNARSKD